MSKSIDWKDKVFLFEDINPLSPSLNTQVIVLYLLPHFFNEFGGVSLEDQFFLEYLVDEFLKEEGGEDVAFLIDFVGEEYKL